MDYLIVGLIGILAFSLELLATKSILPILGGSAQTWIGSLLFFQLALFVSYGINLYIIKGNKKSLNYFILISFSINSLSLLNNWSIETPWPLLTQIFTLAVNYGLIFMGLLMISPQLQLNSNQRPFNFYVASNLGSLIGLLLYPVLIEPFMGLNLQKNILMILSGFIFGWFISKPFQIFKEQLTPVNKDLKNNIIIWSALGTILLSSFSTSLIQDIVSFPLLWVLPLSIYLLTFTWAFSSNPWGKKTIASKSINILEIISIILLAGIHFSIWLDIGLNLILFTLVMLITQNQLSKYAPENKLQLPAFYYLIGLGGLIGGAIANLIVPLVFIKINEYLFFTIIILALIIKEYKITLRKSVSFILIISLLFLTTLYKESFILDSKRSFYGLIRIIKQDNLISMYHGQIVHGQELIAKPGFPTSYYQPNHVGELFKNDPNKILIIGLGSGVLLYYLHPNQKVDVIEVDPLVVDMAMKHFSFINNNQSNKKIIIGDGRKELSKISEKYDLIIVDAFSGDSIPMHLLTKEAFDLYRKHLNISGVLAIHLSNNYLDLKSIVANTANSVGFNGEIKTSIQNDVKATWGVFHNGDITQSEPIWSDDFSSIFSVLKF